MVAVGGVLVLIELVLAAVGVAPLTARADPFHGVSERMRVFEIDEVDGVRRTRARAVWHSFNQQEFPLDKSSDELRVFVLGGSSAYGFPWGARRAFSSVLEQAV